MFKNPLIIHIAVEVALFGALIFWITTTNRRSNNYIQGLLHKIDELEQRIIRLETRGLPAPSPRARPMSPPAPKQPVVMARFPSSPPAPIHEPVDLSNPFDDTEPTIEEVDPEFEEDLKEEIENLEKMD